MKKILLLTFFVCPFCFGDIYWVSNSGSATWTSAKSAVELSGSACCKLDTANKKARAGDTVYLRSGTYDTVTGAAINLTNTGNSTEKIFISSYNNENVNFIGSGTSSYAVNLNSDYGTVRSYIKINDLHFSNFMRHLWILRGTHNEISNCSFIGYPPEAVQSDFNGYFQASNIFRKARYNWIHDCTFGIWGYNATYGADNGGVFGCGLESSTTDSTRYNLIENNEMYAGGHHVAYLNGSYNIYRNNYFHNEPWFPFDTPIFSTRVIAQEGFPGDGMRNLNEKNRIAYGGPKNKDEVGGSGGQVKGAYNIWRKNLYLNAYTNAIYMTKYVSQSQVKYNKIYNNTFYNSGYGSYQRNPGGVAPSSNWENRYTHACVIEEGHGENVFDNVFKNNIFNKNLDTLGKQYSFISRYYDSDTGWITRVPIHQSISNNWLDSYDYPLFVDTTGPPDPTNKNQYNLSLQKGSKCIDSGSFLTYVTSDNGTGTKIKVFDAGYFFYPYGNIDLEIPNALISGDTIQLEGQTVYSIIDTIDYDTDTITLKTPLTFTTNQGVSLKYHGSKPDLGAYEFVNKKTAQITIRR